MKNRYYSFLLIAIISYSCKNDHSCPSPEDMGLSYNSFRKKSGIGVPLHKELLNRGCGMDDEGFGFSSFSIPSEIADEKTKKHLPYQSSKGIYYQDGSITQEEDAFYYQINDSSYYFLRISTIFSKKKKTTGNIDLTQNDSIVYNLEFDTKFVRDSILNSWFK